MPLDNNTTRELHPAVNKNFNELILHQLYKSALTKTLHKVELPAIKVAIYSRGMMKVRT